jgi:DnaJ-domain-containing protein 1
MSKKNKNNSEFDDRFAAMFDFVNIGRGAPALPNFQKMLEDMQTQLIDEIAKMVYDRVDEMRGLHRPTNMNYNAEMDPFAILGIRPGATEQEVDKAYREKAKKCHPDLGGNKEDMVKLNLAYESLRRYYGWTS